MTAEANSLFLTSAAGQQVDLRLEHSENLDKARMELRGDPHQLLFHRLHLILSANRVV
jgi:hypothetical protein